MAKMFITSGEGSQQTLSDIQNEKIPIYDSEQDAEADFANIEEGQIYATKEDKLDVDDMKQYIRNQNILSEWEDITISTYGNNPTEMEYDGVLYCSASANSYNYTSIYYNGVLVFTFPVSGGTYSSASTFPFRKGDKMYFSGSASFKVQYYKLRDYTGR